MTHENPGFMIFNLAHIVFPIYSLMEYLGFSVKAPVSLSPPITLPYNCSYSNAMGHSLFQAYYTNRKNGTVNH
jgi:hypothetical protein